MSISISQVGPCFAGEVSGIDMTKPLSEQDIADIHAGMDEYAVLVFHGQDIDDDQQIAFTASLGEIEYAIGSSLRTVEETRLRTEFADVSNLDKNNKTFERTDRRRQFAIGNRLWHSDSSFKPTPSMYSLLHARVIPSKGGQTEFADMRAAYDTLEDDTKDFIEDMICHHSQMFSRRQVGFFDFTEEERVRMAPARQRLVRRHPSTGRKSLFLASHAGLIEGMPETEGLLILHDLMEHATQRDYVYRHTWAAGDMVIWDNRRTMHRARPAPLEEPRDVRRTTLVGVPTL